MNVVAEMTIQALSAHDETQQLTRYQTALINACGASPPPFGTKRYGDIYRTVASDPYWLATSIITSAEREAEGAGRLWSLSACTRDTEIAACIKQHAIDEARHSRWYIAILDIAFPGAVDASVRDHLDKLSPRYHRKMSPTPEAGSLFAHEAALDDLVQMNIAEIRTAINQRLQRPVLFTYGNESQRRKMGPLVEGLMADEIRHIAYSARLIERIAAADPHCSLEDIMAERVNDFNEITCEEVESGVFALHCSRDSCHHSGVCELPQPPEPAEA